jgi:hypothetical protein
MKNQLSKLPFTIIFIVTIFITSCKTSRPLSTDPKNNIEVSVAFEKVYKSIQIALANSKVDEKFKLTDVELAFATVRTFDVHGNVKFFVALEYEHSRSNSRKSTFKFGEPPPIKNDTIALFKSRNFKDKDQKFIDYLTDVLSSANSIKSRPDFGLNELEVEIEFTIKNNGTEGIDFEFDPVEFGVTTSQEKEVTHTVTITFKRK